MVDTSKIEVIQRLIKINYLMFQEIYFSQEEFYNYYLKFLNIYEKPERALYELTNLSRYFLTMKSTEQNNLKTMRIRLDFRPSPMGSSVLI